MLPLILENNTLEGFRDTSCLGFPVINIKQQFLSSKHQMAVVRAMQARHERSSINNNIINDNKVINNNNNNYVYNLISTLA